MAIGTNKLVFRTWSAPAALPPPTAIINETLVVDGVWLIETIRLHLGAAGGAAENFVVQVDSGIGAAYDLVLVTQNMAAVADVVYHPARPIVLVDPDELDITYANTNNRQWGLEVVYRQAV